MYNSWVEVSKSAILSNLNSFKKIVGAKVEVMPVVKSNAYGHGMVEVARLVSPRVDFIGVVSLDEALRLRHSNIKNRILVLSYFQNELVKEGVRENIELPIYDFNQARYLSLVARRINKTVRVHVKIDTGTSRLGVLAKDATELIKKIGHLSNIKIVGIWSHFAASEENQKYTQFQLRQFSRVLSELEKLNIEIPYKHFACSAAALTRKESHFNLIRLGLSLYGLWPSKSAQKNSRIILKPALSWKTRIIQVKDVAAGTKVGYGCTYTAAKKLRMAVLAVGYCEGYDRHLSNPPIASFRRAGRGEVLTSGRRCPVIGRVCMSLIIVDATRVKNVKVGDEVVLIGRQGGEEITADELAQKVGTINYEIVTRINPSLPRIYLK